MTLARLHVCWMYGIAIHAKERVYWEECLLLQ
jgi:hypothetical protein